MEKWVEDIRENWVYGQVSRGYLDYEQISGGYQALLGVLKAIDT